MDEVKKVLTPEDVAEESGLCLKTVYKELKAGNIRHVKAGDRYLISRENFNRWLSGEHNPNCRVALSY